jgi:hypothetical protein
VAYSGREAFQLADDTLVERRSVRRALGKTREPEPHQPTGSARSTASEPPSTSVLTEENIASDLTSSTREPDSEQIALLLRVAEGFLASGDLSAARTPLLRAARAGNAHAALLLGETYDPALQSQFGIGNSHADRAAARAWYEVARRSGSSDARRWLDRLAHDDPEGDLPSRP